MPQPVPGQGAGTDALLRSAIQVDGGSEFEAEFETACKTKGLILYAAAQAAPAQRRRRALNGAWRYEFYGVYELPCMLDQLNHRSTASGTSTIITDPTAHLTE